MSPSPIPAATPAQNAIIFFNAPPSSTPLTSFEVYTLKFSFMNISLNSFAIFSSSAAITIAVGTALETSSAWLGPDRTASFTFGISCLNTSSNDNNVSFSNPFVHITIV